MSREVTLDDVLTWEHEHGWPLHEHPDPKIEVLRVELVRGARWADFPILTCYACGEPKPATSFPIDRRCNKRRERGYVCNQCKEDRK